MIPLKIRMQHLQHCTAGDVFTASREVPHSAEAGQLGRLTSRAAHLCPNAHVFGAAGKQIRYYINACVCSVDYSNIHAMEKL